MNKKVLSVGILLITLAVVVTASMLFPYPYEPKHPPKADDTGWTQQGIQKVVDANNQFAFDLYSELSKSNKGNIFFSPYSISSALAMTYEGAKGQTAEEIKSVFHFPDKETLEPNFAKIYNEINKQNNTLRTGNALWIQKDFPILRNYTERVEKYYGGKATNVDFIKETEKTRQTINNFIEKQTNGKIKDLIPKGMLDESTRLVITNAIYFKGTWKWEFNKEDTMDMDFHVNSTKVVKVPMMYMKPDKARFNYANLDKLQILELPYKGDKISMLIILPKQGEYYDNKVKLNYTLEDIEFSYEKLKEWKSQMKETKLDAIYLPKFKLETKYFMEKTLRDMGMPTAFSLDADFSGMTGKKDLYIKHVIHQAYVEVNEKGTEAAAATGVVMELKGIMPENIFRADHPFIFIIQDKETGNILFIGRVTDPNQ